MPKEIKCPQCGGNKFSETDNEGIYKCLYCGSIFQQKAEDRKKEDAESISFEEPTDYYNPSSAAKDEEDKGCLLLVLISSIILLLVCLYFLNSIFS